MAKDSEKGTANGVVIEAMPNTLFKVRLADDNEIMAYLSGKMRMHHIRVLIGDNVTVELDPYGSKGRIVKRM